MQGYSTFFPKHWTPQQVVNAINEAYGNKVLQPGAINVYIGKSSEGIKIKMRLNAENKIMTAFPLMEGK